MSKSPTREHLRSVPLHDLLPLGSKPALVITMAEGQWDATLASAYHQGWVLLELDARERPVRAYQKDGVVS